LNRGELFVEDHEGGVGRAYLTRHLLDFALSDECGWVGSDDVLRDPAYHFGAGGVDQPGQLFQMLVDVSRVG
jgi:hypothetical protein